MNNKTKTLIWLSFTLISTFNIVSANDNVNTDLNNMINNVMWFNEKKVNNSISLQDIVKKNEYKELKNIHNFLLQISEKIDQDIITTNNNLIKVEDKIKWYNNNSVSIFLLKRQVLLNNYHDMLKYWNNFIYNYYLYLKYDNKYFYKIAIDNIYLFISKYNKIKPIIDNYKDSKVSVFLINLKSNITLENDKDGYIQYFIENFNVKTWDNKIKHFNHYTLIFNKKKHNNFGINKPFILVYKWNLLKDMNILNMFNIK